MLTHKMKEDSIKKQLVKRISFQVKNGTSSKVLIRNDEHVDSWILIATIRITDNLIENEEFLDHC
jgi:hypothetical protein